MIGKGVGWEGEEGEFWEEEGDGGEEKEWGGHAGQPGGGGGQDGQIPLGPLYTFLLPLHLLLQGSFCQEEVKQSHCRQQQRPRIMHTLVDNKK